MQDLKFSRRINVLKRPWVIRRVNGGIQTDVSEISLVSIIGVDVVNILCR
jgi:hypothetical protein